MGEYTYTLCVLHIPPLALVCPMTPPLPSIEMWAGNDLEQNMHVLTVLVLIMSADAFILWICILTEP